jgi:penicillin-binding protein 1A
MGGRNYNGQLLFNRASDMLNQPASTIKPLLSYALGIEYLGYNSKEVLMDEEYSYSDGSNVNNVDYNYMGEILIEDAIGYSRNTTALSTLESVIEKEGVSKVANYLSTINLLDVNQNAFSISYGLGAFTYGVSPYNLASAYSMIANKGVYQKGYTVKRIINSETNEVLYTHKDEKVRALSISTSDILTNILENVVEKNYYGLGSLKMEGNTLYLKSGTSSFDATLAKQLNYPSNASKDLWIAGFSKQYSFAIWSGFDYPIKGEMNYFKAGSDSRKSLHKEILKRVLEVATTSKGEVELTDEVTPVYIVRGTKLLPDIYTPSSMIVKAYFKKGDEPNETISPLSLKEITNLDLLFSDNYLEITFTDYAILDITKKENTIYSNSKVYGDIEYVIEINGKTYVSNDYYLEIELDDSNYYSIIAYTRYSKANDLTSNKFSKSFTFFDLQSIII